MVRQGLHSIVRREPSGVDGRDEPDDDGAGMSAFSLVAPAREYLEGFAAALRAGWSPSTTRDVSREFLADIERDADAFLADLVSENGVVKLADGTTRPRLPMIVRWMSDGEFCGSINLRWQHGTDALPPHVSGHIGYAVVPWKRGRGYATASLATMLEKAAEVGLGRVEITTDEDNLASQRVIEKAGGVFVGTRPPDPVTPTAKRVYAVDLSKR